MNKIKIAIGFLLSFSLLLSGFIPVFAQEGQNLDELAENMIEEDEETTNEDLGVGNQGILPGSPFYFLKNWRRGIQDFFTFNPVKKAELKLKFANEKMAEVKEMIRKERPEDEVINALENANKELERMRERIEEKGIESEELLEKIIESGLNHQKVIDKLEENFPDIYEKLEEARGNSLGNIMGSSLKIADGEKIREKLEEKLEEGGSQLKHIKSLEVLMRVEEQVPEEAKEAIRKAQDNILKRLEGDLESIPEEEKEILEEYMERVKCNESRCLEVISKIENANISSELRESVEKAKEEMITRIRERLDNFDEEEVKGYLEHLEQGEIRKMIVSEEIEGNLSPEMKPYVSEIRQGAKEMFLERIREAQEEQQRERMLEEAEESASLKSLELLERIRNSAGPNEGFVQEMKERVTSRIRNEIESTEGEKERREKMESFSGGSGELLDTIEETDLPEEVKSQMREIEEEKIMRREGRTEGMEVLVQGPSSSER